MANWAPQIRTAVVIEFIYIIIIVSQLNIKTTFQMKKYARSSNKEEIVICRVEECQEQVIRQNYARHLSRLHPGEKSSDLRPYGQLQLLSFLVTRPRPPPDTTGRDGDGREGEAESSEDINTLETEVEEAGGVFEDLQLEGDGDGRKRDEFETVEVEENPTASEEEEDLVLEEARDRSPLRGLVRERVSREKQIR